MRRLLVALLLAACSQREATPPAPGDIILVTIDTWRADAAGFAGNAQAKTPYLDSLAKRGVVFTNAHAHNVVTLPSHANILTGLLPYQHGIRDNAGFTLDAKFATVATRLKENGYATGAFVAAFPLDARFGLNAGFDVYDDNYGKGASSVGFVVQERPAEAVLEPAARWWRSAAGKKRFLWVHVYDPHAPYANGGYLGEVAAVDAALAKHLAPLVEPSTTVIVTADHGEALGDHGELTHGLFAYEATLKVPLVVVAPELQPRSERAYVRHIDIAPTILARAGVEAPNDLPGRSLLGAIEPRDTYFESLSASLNRGWAPLTGMITGDHKYIDLPIAELYDLPRDPAEGKNLRAEKRREVEAARRMLAGVLTIPAERKLSSEEAARLRSLGYITGTASSTKPYTEADDPKNLIALDGKMHAVTDAHERGDARRALALAREVVAEKPDMAAGHELLAFVLQQNEQIDAAIEELRGLTAEPARRQLGLLLTESGRAAEAVEVLAPLSATRDPDAINAYGIALADVGRPAEAVQQFRRALDLDPNNAPALQNLGIVALRQNDVRAAHDFLQRALALNPRLPLALNTLGVVYARQGDTARAVDAWNRAVALDPRQYDALFNIGMTEGRAGRYAEAKRALQRFVESAPPERYARELDTARQALRALR